MKKYRIVANIDYHSKNKKFFIETKKFLGWKKISVIEDNISTDLSFKTFEDAEQHIIRYYSVFNETFYQPRVNEYHIRIIVRFFD